MAMIPAARLEMRSGNSGKQPRSERPLVPPKTSATGSGGELPPQTHLGPVTGI